MIRNILLLVAALALAGGCAKPSYGYGGGGGGGGGDGVRTASVQSVRSEGWRGSRYRSYRPSRSYSRSYRRAPASPAPVAPSADAAKESPEPAVTGSAGGAMPVKKAPGGASTPAEPPADEAADGRPAGGTAGSGSSGSGSTGPAVATGAKVPRMRLIIYRGALILQVIQLNDAMEAAQKLALEMGAYLQSRANNQLTFRVPVEKFQPLLKALESIGEVASKSIHADDVTQQYYDIAVRLKAAETVFARLQALLAQAKNVEESLAIEREMARLLETIERFKGTLRYLRHHASLSTLTITFRVKPAYSRPIQSQWRSPFHWVQGLGLWRMMSH